MIKIADKPVEPPSLFDSDGNLILPSNLLDSTVGHLTAASLWVKLAEMLPAGEDTLIFDSVAQMSKEINYTNHRFIYKVLSRLEALGWIESSYPGPTSRPFTIRLFPEPKAKP